MNNNFLRLQSVIIGIKRFKILSTVFWLLLHSGFAEHLYGYNEFSKHIYQSSESLKINYSNDNDFWFPGGNFLNFIFPFIELNKTDENKFSESVAKEFEAPQHFIDLIPDRVLNILKLLTENSGIKEPDFRIRIIRSYRLNAFSLNTGYIWITSGLLEFLKDDNELAFAIAHEMSHEYLQHNKKKISVYYLNKFIIGSSISSFRLLAHSLAVTPYDKLQEFEADQNAILLMKNAGFNSAVIKNFFDKLSLIDKVEKSDLGYQYRTHPYPEERKSNLFR